MLAPHQNHILILKSYLYLIDFSQKFLFWQVILYFPFLIKKTGSSLTLP